MVFSVEALMTRMRGRTSTAGSGRIGATATVACVASAFVVSTTTGRAAAISDMDTIVAGWRHEITNRTP
jgi:hypothetical protein